MARRLPSRRLSSAPIPSVGGLRTGLLAEPLPAALGPITLSFDDNTISDLWLAITWGAP